MSNFRARTENCLKCDTSFQETRYHALNLCRRCYNTERKTPKEPKKDYCSKCMCLFGSISSKKKELKEGPMGLCKPCYAKHYAATSSTDCKRCGKDMGKKVKGVCPLCRIDLEQMKSPSKRNLPSIGKINIDRETKEMMRRVFNRYKFGTNTLIDPFVVTNLYLTVFSSESTKGMTASKTEFNLDQFDQASQVLAMLKLLKSAYDKC